MTSLLIDPACDFSALRARLEPLRWAVVSSTPQPILPGEPELAAFERSPGERAIYTFNPACRLRVLDFRGAIDGATLAALPSVSATQIGEWLTSTDERTLLRALLAANLQPDAGFAPRVDALVRHPREVIASAAQRARVALRAIGVDARFTPPPPTGADASRQTALAAIAIIQSQVEPLLRALPRDTDGSVTTSLRPRPDDYARVFTAEAAERARRAYESIWKTAPHVTAPPAARLETHVAPAGMLAYDNELSTHFPAGYRHIAHLLSPNRAWVRWKYVRPGESSGMSYDGLVWCDDHWAWFPKPFRALATPPDATADAGSTLRIF
jgi:hypothetical protein